MFNKKKMLATTLGAVFALSAFGSALAAETTTQTQTSIIIEKHVGGGDHIGKKGANLEEIAKEKGITVDELKAQMEQEREAKLAERAAEQGMTVDELKAQMEQERKAKKQEKLEKLAAEKGITVDELKAQIEQKRETKLAELAKEKGITVDELKAQFEQNGHGFRGLR